MKFLFAFIITLMTLHAGMFDSKSRDERVQNQAILDQFRQNVRDSNAIVKRGEYDLIAQQEREIAKISATVSDLKIAPAERAQLTDDLKTYAQLVKGISSQLRRQAQELNTHYQEVLGGLAVFNKRLGSIGLRELLHSWRELSRIKSRFVKQPSAKLVKAFDQEWTTMTVTITELYLDEEMEQPLFDYLDNYKAYFNELNSAYRSAGYAEVAKLKPLTYQIKMRFELLAPEVVAGR